MDRNSSKKKVTFDQGENSKDSESSSSRETSDGPPGVIKFRYKHKKCQTEETVITKDRAIQTLPTKDEKNQKSPKEKKKKNLKQSLSKQFIHISKKKLDKSLDHSLE